MHHVAPIAVDVRADHAATGGSAEDLMLHGDSYDEENGFVRPSACSSCAFRSDDRSIRHGTGVTLQEAEEFASELDDFLCHCLDASGRAYTCAGWAARFSTETLIPFDKPTKWQD